MTCSVIGCRERDELALVQCRDGRIRCAYHANRAGYCWNCGEGSVPAIGGDITDGLCNDCYAAQKPINVEDSQ